jgi:hypothetical protein
MIFHPAILALLLASGVATLMLLWAAPFAVQILRRWDLASGSEFQLGLERRTHLLSTLLGFVLVTQVAGTALFVFTADRLAGRFVGAMCAVGTLNVNAWGFPALYAQIAVFFAAAVWLVLNHVDQRSRDYPLVRIKHALLLGLTPLVVASFGLQAAYFAGLRADVITSCCGSLFSTEAPTLTGEVAAMEPGPAMVILAHALALAMIAALLHRRRPRPATGYALAGLSALAFVASLAGIVSFVSLYVYEHPHHHCPFCILKPEYGYQGYALYVPLFVASAAGLAAGALQPFLARRSLALQVPATSARLAAVAGWGFALFAAVATAMVASSNLVLLGS